MRVAVIGAGVTGLTVACELAEAGHEVCIVAEHDTPDTVSAITAALWFPHATEQSEASLQMLRRSRARFDELARDRDTGVVPMSGVIFERLADADHSWFAAAPDAAFVPERELLPGALAGVRATLPFIEMPIYLPWLRRRAQSLGIGIEVRRIDDPAELADEADAVVVACGIRGGELLGDDDTVFPIRGQVVCVANPGLTEWFIDTDDPLEMIYVFPRTHDVVVGGIGEAGSWSTEVDADTEAAMLERAARVIPQLAGQPVLSRAAGLRPARPTIRIEHVDRPGVPVIAAYGHGGAGVTLSWGTAERVAALVKSL